MLYIPTYGEQVETYLDFTKYVGDNSPTREQLNTLSANKFGRNLTVADGPRYYNLITLLFEQKYPRNHKVLTPNMGRIPQPQWAIVTPVEFQNDLSSGIKQF
jgi:hypothetical protein